MRRRQFAGSLLMAGTKTHTRQQIQDEMRKLNAIQVSGGGGGGGFGGRGGGGAAAAAAAASSSATRQHHGAGGELHRRRCGSRSRCCKEPAYPQDEFDRVKTQRVQGAGELPPTEPTQLAARAAATAI